MWKINHESFCYQVSQNFLRLMSHRPSFSWTSQSSSSRTFPNWGQPVHFVEALCYNMEGCGFDSRWHYYIFSIGNSSSRTMSMRSTQPLTEMSTRNIGRGRGVKRLPACKAVNLTAIYKLIFSENVGVLMSHNLAGLHGRLQGQLYVFFTNPHLSRLKLFFFIFSLY
jgi:hypothetical protein